MDLPTTVAHNDPFMEKLIREKRTAREFQERKHDDWNDNYELYRNKVRTNRLTQRQAVNIPLMKETVKTLLSKIDDVPNVDWRELSGDQQKELIYQEVWNNNFKKKKFEQVDMIDKKNVLVYGRGFKKLNLDEDGNITVQALDPFDVLIDPMCNPMDIESARFVIQQNIFKSLREILADERYTEKGKSVLKIWSTQEEGMIQSAKNKEEWEKKQERLRSMGVDDSEFAHFAGGDVIVNLSEHYTNKWNNKTKEFERRVVVYANDDVELMDEKLEDMIGVSFYPIVTWAEDLEVSDFWSDSPADLVRTPNKILNIWFSQLVENRTLRNFQMHWYDATVEGYKPQTYEPGPGRMLPAPGDPNKTIMPVDVQGLDETLTAIDFIIRIIERGTGATAIEKGVSEKKQITLGEVEMLVGKAAERTIGMAKYYRASWYELAVKWDAMMYENAPERLELYKTDRNGKMYPKVVYPVDWRSEKGYEPIVSSSSEQEEETIKGIQKFGLLLQQFPDNAALKRIAQKRMLEMVDLTPEELREVQEAEEQKLEQMIEPGAAEQVLQQNQPQPQPAGVPAMQGTETPQDVAEAEELISQLTQ